MRASGVRSSLKLRSFASAGRPSQNLGPFSRGEPLSNELGSRPLCSATRSEKALALIGFRKSTLLKFLVQHCGPSADRGLFLVSSRSSARSAAPHSPLLPPSPSLSAHRVSLLRKCACLSLFSHPAAFAPLCPPKPPRLHLITSIHLVALILYANLAPFPCPCPAAPFWLRADLSPSALSAYPFACACGCRTRSELETSFRLPVDCVLLPGLRTLPVVFIRLSFSTKEWCSTSAFCLSTISS